ncbi:hypothetical protein ARTHRO9AX_30018 [Arthrobacter sp. 9AX]|nr:hypothetical protein ARTHRO9AX_30018 [Arthrobacter sp. 9AX]
MTLQVPSFEDSAGAGVLAHARPVTPKVRPQRMARAALARMAAGVPDQQCPEDYRTFAVLDSPIRKHSPAGEHAYPGTAERALPARPSSPLQHRS